MNAKYTYGPWMYNLARNKAGKLVATISDADEYTIAVFLRDPADPFDNVEADGRLIAAAPELLKALKEMYLMEGELTDNSSDYDYEISQGNQQAVIKKNALIAINKAEGKS